MNNNDQKFNFNNEDISNSYIQDQTTRYLNGTYNYNNNQYNNSENNSPYNPNRNSQIKSIENSIVHDRNDKSIIKNNTIIKDPNQLQLTITEQQTPHSLSILEYQKDQQQNQQQQQSKYKLYQQQNQQLTILNESQNSLKENGSGKMKNSRFKRKKKSKLASTHIYKSSKTKIQQTLKLKNKQELYKQQDSFHEELMQEIQRKQKDKIKYQTYVRQFFFVFKWLKKFQLNLLHRIPSRKFSYLKQTHFKMIDDLSSNYKYYKINNQFVQDRPSKLEIFNYNIFLSFVQKAGFIVRPYRKFQKNLNIVIMPDSIFKLIWDTFILWLLVLNIFYIPIKIAFQGGDRDNYSDKFSLSPWMKYVLDYIPQFAFLLDIFMNFNTAVYKRGKIIANRPEIADIYLKGRFFWDFIVVTPFIISMYFNIPFIDTILLLRQKKIRIIIKQYEELINLRGNQLAIYKLSKLVLFILFVAHFTGCLFYFLADQEIQIFQIEDTWLHQYDLMNKEWFEQYISAFYWAVITMITVGYGDIAPQTQMEKQFAIIMTMISCGVFAYSVNSIGTIVQSMTARDDQFDNEMATLTTYMRNQKLDKILQMRVKNYFEYLHEENIQEETCAEELLSQLCDSLKQEVNQSIYFKEIMKKKQLRLNFSIPFLKELSHTVKHRILGPEEIIYECGQFNDTINILVKGSAYLELTQQQSTLQKQVYQLQQGDMFGIASFFTGKKTTTGARTKNVCKLMYISKEQFLQILQSYPKDYEKYCYLRDQEVLNCDQIQLKNPCYICESYSHNLSRCPLILHIPNKDKILHKFQMEDNLQQQRCQFTIIRRQFNDDLSYSLVNMSYFKSMVLAYLADNCKQDELEDIIRNNNFVSCILEDNSLSLDKSIQNDAIFLNSRNKQYSQKTVVSRSIKPSQQSSQQQTSSKDDINIQSKMKQVMVMVKVSQQLMNQSKMSKLQALTSKQSINQSNKPSFNNIINNNQNNGQFPDSSVAPSEQQRKSLKEQFMSIKRVSRIFGRKETMNSNLISSRNLSNIFIESPNKNKQIQQQQQFQHQKNSTSSTSPSVDLMESKTISPNKGIRLEKRSSHFVRTNQGPYLKKQQKMHISQKKTISDYSDPNNNNTQDEQEDQDPQNCSITGHLSFFRQSSRFNSTQIQQQQKSGKNLYASQTLTNKYSKKNSFENRKKTQTIRQKHLLSKAKSHGINSKIDMILHHTNSCSSNNGNNNKNSNNNIQNYDSNFSCYDEDPVKSEYGSQAQIMSNMKQFQQRSNNSIFQKSLGPIINDLSNIISQVSLFTFKQSQQQNISNNNQQQQQPKITFTKQQTLSQQLQQIDDELTNIKNNNNNENNNQNNNNISFINDQSRFLLVNDLDKLKRWSIYFPKMNYENVLTKHNEKREQKMQEQSYKQMSKSKQNRKFESFMKRYEDKHKHIKNNATNNKNSNRMSHPLQLVCKN